MRLVDKHNIGLGQLAPRKRLHRGNLHRCLRVRAFVVAAHHADVVDAPPRKLSHGLVDQLEPMRKKQHARAEILPGARDNRRGDNGFAAACWKLEQNARTPRSHMRTERLDSCRLIRPQGYH